MTDSPIAGQPQIAAETSHGALVAAPPAPRTLLDVFAATVARCEARTAIEAPDARLTYAELSDAARALA